MEDPGAGAGDQEDHHTVLQLPGGGRAAVAATPEPGCGLLADDDEFCSTPDARLFISEEGEKGVDFAVGLVDPVEAVSASLVGRICEATEAKGSSLEGRLMGMEEEKGGCLPFSPQGCTEPGSLWTCREANGGLLDNASHVRSGEAGCSKDVECVYGTLDKAIEGNPCEREDLIGNGGGDWAGVAELKTCMDDLYMAVSEEANHCNDDPLGLMKPSEQWQSGVDGLGTIADANNEIQQHDLAHAYSVPSVSGNTGVSVDRKAVQFLKSSDIPVTSHVAGGRLRNNSCDLAGCMHDMVGMVTEGNPREQNSLGGEGV
ncbi:hypothetical protein PR202_gb08773 [Eleusine coracana subsp. coracana]|uniref:Uncharacterized protein n=1 Tax=Eleusine coracana subsp. coracana TaxID=191504 RepID=A0AAV5EG21_ELECO|nr:hypothetical protein PR202_gb08773 [Eleusine coracana subsp. coracana]